MHGIHWQFNLSLRGQHALKKTWIWLQYTEYRLAELYYRSMEHILQDINELCSRDIYLRFADDKVRCSRAFFHVLVKDGAETAWRQKGLENLRANQEGRDSVKLLQAGRHCMLAEASAVSQSQAEPTM